MVSILIPVDVIMLDFAKAFDTVPHRRLLAKLKAYGINGLVYKWIEAFLKNRKQRIIQGKVVSSWADIFSGVPQGSVLGPLLFIIYINDLPKIISSLTKLYADDTKILSVMNSEECCGKIQADLDNAYEWTQEWLLKFNIDKCYVMHYGFNNKKYPLYINGKQLVESDLERDLGIMFSTSLKWKNQVITATNRANQMLGRIKKSFALFDCKLMRSLYLTFIRPYLEFAVPVWCPFLKGDIDMIEQVQQRATKLIPAIRNLSYENRLRKLELTTLKDRRLRGDLIQMFKIMNKMDKCDRYNRFKIILNQVRGHCFKYFKEITRQPYRENFFYNRVVNIWNQLPSEIVEATSVNSFKAGIDHWMSSGRSNQLS